MRQVVCLGMGNRGRSLLSSKSSASATSEYVGLPSVKRARLRGDHNTSGRALAAQWEASYEAVATPMPRPCNFRLRPSQIRLASSSKKLAEPLRAYIAIDNAAQLLARAQQVAISLHAAKRNEFRRLTHRSSDP